MYRPNNYLFCATVLREDETDRKEIRHHFYANDEREAMRHVKTISQVLGQVGFTRFEAESLVLSPVPDPEYKPGESLRAFAGAALRVAGIQNSDETATDDE